MALGAAALDAYVCEIDEEQIGKSVDDFGGVLSGIVVLVYVSNCRVQNDNVCKLLHTNLESM